MNFGGRLFGGRLFAGRLFGPDAQAAVSLPLPGQADLEPLDPRRVREFWDELDAQQQAATASTPGVAEVGAVDAPPTATEPARALAPVGAVEIVLPGGRRAVFDPGTRAIAPAPGSAAITDFSDEDMQAVLLALCLLDLDD